MREIEEFLGGEEQGKWRVEHMEKMGTKIVPLKAKTLNLMTQRKPGRRKDKTS